MGVAGGTPFAGHGADIVGQGGAADLAFARPLAVKMHHVKIHGGEVQGGAGGLFNDKGGGAAVADNRRPGDGAVIVQHPVKQMDFRPGERVLHENIQSFRLTFISVNGGKPFQSIFPLPDGVAAVPQAGGGGAVFPQNGQGGHPVIAGPVDRVLLEGRVQGKGGVIRRVGGERGHLQGALQIGKIGIRNTCSVIQMEQIPMGVNTKRIAGRTGVQAENLLFRVKKNRHRIILSWPECWRLV